MEKAGAVGYIAPDEAALWEKYSLPIYRYLLHLTGRREYAERLTQASFEEALRELRRGETRQDEPSPGSGESLGSGESPGSGQGLAGGHNFPLRSRLFQIATRRGLAFVRRRRYLSLGPGKKRPLDLDTSSSNEEQERVCLALQKVAPEAATVLLLSDTESFTVHEIAAMLALGQGVVLARLDFARAALAAEIGAARLADSVATTEIPFGLQLRRRGPKPVWLATAAAAVLVLLISALARMPAALHTPTRTVSVHTGQLSDPAK